MKRYAGIAVLMILVLAFSVSAEASVMGQKVYPTLTISGSTATCKLKIYKSGAYINVTLELYRDGIPIVSWNESGTSTVAINETYTVTSGHTYYVYAYGTAGGAAFNGQSACVTI